MIDKEMLKGILKISVLQAISNEDTYGYELIKTLRDTSNERINLKEGTLYPILHAFEANHDIESYWEEGDTGRRRKYYRITEDGKQTLNALSSDWNLLKETMTHLLKGDHHGTA